MIIVWYNFVLSSVSCWGVVCHGVWSYLEELEEDFGRESIQRVGGSENGVLALHSIRTRVLPQKPNN